ncbi:hypothetical protein F4778DRAFT_727429 [Xylariomycetidae sp. FL2044]|nr:hypothetical protein F4778DRAFT_727429 [Xylariomycetidae sp. FL2044]
MAAMDPVTFRKLSAIDHLDYSPNYLQFRIGMDAWDGILLRTTERSILDAKSTEIQAAVWDLFQVCLFVLGQLGPYSVGYAYFWLRVAELHGGQVAFHYLEEIPSVVRFYAAARATATMYDGPKRHDLDEKRTGQRLFLNSNVDFRLQKLIDNWNYRTRNETYWNPRISFFRPIHPRVRILIQSARGSPRMNKRSKRKRETKGGSTSVPTQNTCGDNNISDGSGNTTPPESPARKYIKTTPSKGKSVARPKYPYIIIGPDPQTSYSGILAGVYSKGRTPLPEGSSRGRVNGVKGLGHTPQLRNEQASSNGYHSSPQSPDADTEMGGTETSEDPQVAADNPARQEKPLDEDDEGYGSSDDSEDGSSDDGEYDSHSIECGPSGPLQPPAAATTETREAPGDIGLPPLRHPTVLKNPQAVAPTTHTLLDPNEKEPTPDPDFTSWGLPRGTRPVVDGNGVMIGFRYGILMDGPMCPLSFLGRREDDPKTWNIGNER